MKYIVGTNQKIKLYTARFGILSKKYNTQNAVKGIVDHNTKPTASGIYGHKALFVEVLWNILSLYSTLLALEIKYGDKIIVANKRKAPPGIKTITFWAIKTAIEVSTKNIKFQKLSLFNLALIKLCIIVPTLINIINSYDIKHWFKKPRFSRNLVTFAINLLRYLEKLLCRCNITKKVTA